MPHRLIVGLTGSGKTYRTARDLRRRSRVLVATPYPDDFAVSTLVLPWDKAWSSMKRYPDQPCRICVKYPPGNQEKTVHFVDEISRYAYHNPGWIDTLIVDECQRLRIGKDVSDDFALLMDEGRHINLEVWAVGRRPIQVPMLLRSQCRTQITFRQNSARDIKILEDYYGDHASLARELQLGEYLFHDDAKLEIIKFSKNNEIVSVFH